jgi:hypothetical protein
VASGHLAVFAEPDKRKRALLHKHSANHERQRKEALGAKARTAFMVAKQSPVSSLTDLSGWRENEPEKCTDRRPRVRARPRKAQNMLEECHEKQNLI